MSDPNLSSTPIHPKTRLSLADYWPIGLHRIAAGFAYLNPLIKTYAFFSLMIFADSLMAADWDIPAISAIDGLSDDEDPGSMIKIFGIWTLRVVCWIACLGTGFIVISNIVRSIKKIHRDEDGRWSSVIGEILGNTVTFLFVLGLSAWLLSQFT